MTRTLGSVGRYRSPSIALVLALAAAVGCTTEGASAENDEANVTSSDAKDLFDVNDISILFGRDDKGEMVPSIPVSDKDGAGNEIWPQAAFDELMTFAKGNGADDPAVAFDRGKADERAKWRLVGVRFSPCGPASNIRTPDADTAKRMQVLGLPGCLVQVRMVAQPLLATSNGRLKDLDFAAHLVYSVGPITGNVPDAIKTQVAGAQAQMLADLQEIKRLSTAAGAPTTGEPLGVHPALRLEAKNGSRKVADAVEAWVKKYVALTPQIRTIAFMGLRNDNFEPWVFTSGKVEGGHWKAGPLPSFIDFANPASAATAPKHMRLSFIEDSAVIVGKDRALRNGAAPSAELNTSTLFDSPPPSNAEAARIAFGVEKPGSTNILNTDCVTCHTDSERIATLGLRSTADRMRVPRGITGYVSSDSMQSDNWNTRNFGYFGGKPTVSLRTLNETVEFAQFLNLAAQSDKPESQRLPGPARDCTAKDDAVFDCIVHGSECGDKTGNAVLTTCGKFLSDEPARTPAATPALAVTVLPEQCGRAATSNVSVKDDGQRTSVSVNGSDAECLSRIFDGAFLQEKGEGRVVASVHCVRTNDCTVTVGTSQDGSTKLSGAQAAELHRRLRVPAKDGHRVWESTGPDTSGASVKIDCTESACTIQVKK